MDKVVRDGRVAVLISPGFGAGWSTWCHGDDHFYVFDSGLVEMAERHASATEVEAYIKEKLGPDNYHYMGGWGNIRIEWLDEGTQFTIEEYDGSESIRTVTDLSFTA